MGEMREMETRLGLPVMEFEDAPAFENWLAGQPSTSSGIWLKLVKKGTGAAGVGKAEAIDAALCHGWIDGQQHPYDDACWLTRFTPRRRASRWSQVNRTRAEQLIGIGRMQSAGLAEVERARGDGRWEAAYAPASTATPSPQLQAALDASPKAAAAFAALKGAERYATLHRLANLKTPGARSLRISAYVATLEAGGTVVLDPNRNFHPNAAALDADSVE